MRIKFHGVGVALVTPFKEDGSLDLPSLEKLVELQVNNGTDYLVVLGTTGENVTLTDKEKDEVVQCVLKANAKRLPIVLGMGGNDTLALINKLEKTHFDGIDALLSVSPYYNKPTQEGIYQHYTAMSAKSPLPIILYNVPGRTASNLTAETTLRLANDCTNVIGVKEASGNIEQVMAIIKGAPEGFRVISGDDAITLPIIASGGHGVISVVANAFPNEFSFMVHQAMEGNYGQARTFHYKLFELIQYLFIDGNPAGVKQALQYRGICGTAVRLPLIPVRKETAEKIGQLILENKLLSKLA